MSQENNEFNPYTGLELGEYDSFSEFKNPKEIVEFMLHEDNTSAGFKAFREIALMLAENPDDFYYVNWTEIEEEMHTFPEVPIGAILMQGIQAVFKVASLKVKKKKSKKKKDYDDDYDEPMGGSFF